MRALTITLTMLFSLLVGPPAVAQVETEMTTEQAGRAYLEGFCKDVYGYTKFERVVWHGRDRISTAEVRVRLPKLKRAALVYSKALAAAARKLYNPDAGAWPASVESLVTRVANSTANESYIRRRQGFVQTADGWLRANGQANRAYEKRGAAPTKIRAILNLPAEGGC